MSKQSEIEAIARERGRCLWVLDKIIKDLQADLNKKLLLEQQRHVAEVKLRIARVIVSMARRGIASGLERTEPIHEQEDS